MQSPNLSLEKPVSVETTARTTARSPWPWWSRVVALIALVNLLLGLFNLSYISLRDVYLRQVPAIVSLYDPIKGIEPHPATQQYLQTVDQLSQQMPRLGLEAPQIQQQLAALREQSVALVEENPFLVANKAGGFAKLKQQMQSQLQADSAKAAFETFWSPTYLAATGWENAQSFFDRQIRPLLQVNYFRQIDENGQFVDLFWRIDLWFIAFFAVEFLGRTWNMSRTHANLHWGDAMLRRWYDLFLLLPLWRWLRVIPVAARLHEAGWINLKHILAQVAHEPAAYFADRASEFLMVRLVNQTQEAIEQGGTNGLLARSQPYVRVSDVDKIDALTDRLLQLTIFKVLPQVQPDLRDLLHHSLEKSLKQFDLFPGLRSLPAFGGLPTEALEQLADYLAQAVGDVLTASYSDIEGRELLNQLTRDIKRSLTHELQDTTTQAELQSLLGDLLEELKLNYIQKAAQSDPEETLAEVEQIHQAFEQPSPQPTQPFAKPPSL